MRHVPRCGTAHVVIPDIRGFQIHSNRHRLFAAPWSYNSDADKPDQCRCIYCWCSIASQLPHF